jgi:hypothetical protein
MEEWTDIRLLQTAIFLQRQILLERILYSCAFLHLFLDIYTIAKEWKENHQYIERIAETFEYSGVCLPSLHLKRRSNAKHELKRYIKLYKELEYQSIPRQLFKCTKRKIFIHIFKPFF